jgi:hypothetical protein
VISGAGVQTFGLPAAESIIGTPLPDFQQSVPGLGSMNPEQFNYLSDSGIGTTPAYVQDGYGANAFDYEMFSQPEVLAAASTYGIQAGEQAAMLAAQDAAFAGSGAAEAGAAGGMGEWGGPAMLAAGALLDDGKIDKDEVKSGVGAWGGAKAGAAAGTAILPGVGTVVGGIIGGVLGSSVASKCFITTAVCESQDKPDDCYELQILREFRDSYMMLHYPEEVEEYYLKAPNVVAAIKALPADESEAVFNSLYHVYILPAIYAIESDDPYTAHDIYKTMFEVASEYCDRKEKE